MSTLATETTIDTSLVVNWNNMRQDERNLPNFFAGIGNNFTFTWPTDITEDFHVYICLDNSNKVSFYLIKDSQDTIKNTSANSFAVLSSDQTPLPRSTSGGSNPNTITWDTANTRINNWLDDDSRNQWISDQFKNGKAEDAIAQVFVVNAMDVVPGMEHTAYLALSGDKTKGFEIDLILVNSNGQITQIEDMVHSVPPWGDSLPNFGLINQALPSN